MYEGNEHLIVILDNSFEYRQTHQHIHLEKVSLKPFHACEETFSYWEFKNHSLTGFEHQTKTTAVLIL